MPDTRPPVGITVVGCVGAPRRVLAPRVFVPVVPTCCWPHPPDVPPIVVIAGVPAGLLKIELVAPPAGADGVAVAPKRLGGCDDGVAVAPKRPWVVAPGFGALEPNGKVD